MLNICRINLVDIIKQETLNNTKDISVRDLYFTSRNWSRPMFSAIGWRQSFEITKILHDKDNTVERRLGKIIKTTNKIMKSSDFPRRKLAHRLMDIAQRIQEMMNTTFSSEHTWEIKPNEKEKKLREIILDKTMGNHTRKTILTPIVTSFQGNTSYDIPRIETYNDLDSGSGGSKGGELYHQIPNPATGTVNIEKSSDIRKGGIARIITPRGYRQYGKGTTTPFGLHLRLLLTLPHLELLTNIIEKEKTIVVQEHTIGKTSTRTIRYYENQEIMKCLSDITSILSRGIPYPIGTLAVRNKGFTAFNDMLWNIAKTDGTIKYVKTDISKFFDNVNRKRAEGVYSYYTYTRSAHHMNDKAIQAMGDIFQLIATPVPKSTTSKDLKIDINDPWDIVDGVYGICQGMPGAPLAADLYLHSFDRDMWKTATRLFNGIYMRWVDDIVIFYSGNLKHEQVTNRLFPKIMAQGLEVNIDKTEHGTLTKNRLHWVGTIMYQDANKNMIVKQKHKAAKDLSVLMMKYKTNIVNEKDLETIIEEVETRNKVITSMFGITYLMRIYEEASSQKDISFEKNDRKFSDVSLVNGIEDIAQMYGLQYLVKKATTTSRRINRYAYSLQRHTKKSKNPMVRCDDKIFLAIYLTLKVAYAIFGSKSGKHMSTRMDALKAMVTCIETVVGKVNINIKKTRKKVTVNARLEVQK